MRGYLTGVRCRLAYGPADATTTQCLVSVKSRLVLPFWYRLTRVDPEKGPLNVCMYVCSCYILYVEKNSVSVHEYTLCLNWTRQIISIQVGYHLSSIHLGRFGYQEPRIWLSCHVPDWPLTVSVSATISQQATRRYQTTTTPRVQQQLCHSPDVGSRYWSISADTRAPAVGSIMLRAEVQGSTL